MTEPDPNFWPHILLRLSAHEALSADEAAEAMRTIMSGDASPGQIGGFLMALRTKGETVDEVDGLARTMLEFANPVRSPLPSVDVVGTGGDTLLRLATTPIAGAEIDGMPVRRGFADARFGYFVMERGDSGWDGTLYAVDDTILARCRIAGREIDCR